MNNATTPTGAPRLSCPECDGEGFLVTCASRHSGVCDCREVRVDCETCEGAGTVADEDAPTTREEAVEMVDEALHEMGQADEAAEAAMAALRAAEERLEKAKTRRAYAREQLARFPVVDAEGVCSDCETQSTGPDGRAAFCKAHMVSS